MNNIEGVWHLEVCEMCGDRVRVFFVRVGRSDAMGALVNVYGFPEDHVSNQMRV